MRTPLTCPMPPAESRHEDRHERFDRMELLMRQTLCIASVSLLCLLTPTRAAEKVHNVLDFGAQPDGKTLCTTAIQKAIDACAKADGGVVLFPPGVFRSGTLRLESQVTLQLDEGATLLGSTDHRDYYRPATGSHGRADDKGTLVFRHLIQGEGVHDIAIRGAGTIDGSGTAFRDKSKPRTKAIYLIDCRNVLIEGVRLRSAGSWMQHYRRCENVTIRGIDVFNHVAFNNDGLDVDSCRDVTITDCHIDSDDDAIVLKSLSNRPCEQVRITGCTVSSHCNALKLGTESGGGFVDIDISNCRVSSPQRSQKTYGRQRGLAGVALEIVDGGRLENVSVTNVDIQGVSVPIFLRLGNRARPYGSKTKPGIGTFRNVRLTNITAQGTSAIGCAIAGLPGHPIENVTLTNVRLGFEGGGTLKDTQRAIGERETSYPESTMFGTLPAYGFFCRHVRGLRFVNVQLETAAADARHAMVFDDAQDITVTGLVASSSPRAAAQLRLTQVQGAVVSGCAPTTSVDTLLQIEGRQTRGIVVEQADRSKIRQFTNIAPDVPKDAVSVK